MGGGDEQADWAETFSRLTFWYGIEFEAAAEMGLEVIQAYLERLPARQAELKLMLADVVTLPHMKKGDRTSAINSWMRAASVAQPNQGARVASKGRLKMMGIGVRHV